MIKTVQFEIEILQSIEDLLPDEKLLLSHAVDACEGAYAPYSKFKVGAAILLENEKIIVGNNQENAAYPSGLCAERVAVYAASSQFPDTTIKKMAITASAPNYLMSFPITPCGACRQSILEYELKQNQEIILILRGETGEIYRICGIKKLLPLYFGESSLTGKK